MWKLTGIIPACLSIQSPVVALMRPQQRVVGAPEGDRGIQILAIPVAQARPACAPTSRSHGDSRYDARRRAQSRHRLHDLVPVAGPRRHGDGRALPPCDQSTGLAQSTCDAPRESCSTAARPGDRVAGGHGGGRPRVAPIACRQDAVPPAGCAGTRRPSWRNASYAAHRRRPHGPHEQGLRDERL